jgi:hypothetical protein
MISKTKGFRETMTTKDKIHFSSQIYFKETMLQIFYKETILTLITTVGACKKVFMYLRAKIIYKMLPKLTKMKMLLHAPVDKTILKNSKF